MKRKGKNPQLQREIDNGNFVPSYDFIMVKQGLDPTHKILLNQMCSDVYLNGMITWKHASYAKKTGLTRRQIIRHFKTYEEKGILIPDFENKPGSKSNTFELVLHRIDLLIKTKKKHVTPEVKTCDTGGIEPVTPEVKTCDTDVTYMNTYEYSKNIHIGEEASFEDASSKDKKTKVTDADLALFANDLDI